MSVIRVDLAPPSLAPPSLHMRGWVSHSIRVGWPLLGIRVWFMGFRCFHAFYYIIGFMGSFMYPYRGH
jgi:hypothetical protein